MPAKCNVGDNDVVGANSTVTKSFPDNVVMQEVGKDYCQDRRIPTRNKERQMKFAPCYDEDYTLRGNLTEEKKQQNRRWKIR